MFTLIRPKIWGGPGLPGLLGDYIPATGNFVKCAGKKRVFLQGTVVT